MAGIKTNKEKLNAALRFAGHLMETLNIRQWFIGYGTLLGIAREGECIDKDDDVDIIVDHVYYDIIKNKLENLGIEIDYGHGIGDSTRILKTKPNKEIGSIDFYCSEVTHLIKMDMHDKWERVIWRDCWPFEEVKFKDTKLNLPNNYKSKLECRYGNWKIPSDKKKGGKTPNNLQ